MSYQIKDSNISHYFEILNVERKPGILYVLPEALDENTCLLNAHTIEFSKDLRESGFTVDVLKSDEYQYYVTKSADIILPLIYGIPFSIFANFITDWLKANYYSGQEKNKIIKLRYSGYDKNGKPKEIELEGVSKNINETLEKMKDVGIFK